MTGRTIVDALCEAVQTGALFLDTSDPGFLPDPGYIYAPTTMREKAAKEFVTLWSYTLQASAKLMVNKHPPTKVVDGLIQKHGLVVIVKRRAAELSHVAEVQVNEPPGQKSRTFTALGIDGILNYQDVVNLILAGKIKPETYVKQRGKSHSKPASRWPEFEQAFKSAGKGSLATKPDDLGKALRGALNKPGPELSRLTAPQNTSKYRFIYASAVPKPEFSPAQVAKIIELFSPEPADPFYRIECLADCKKVVDETTFGKLVGKEEVSA